jgi:glycosyltransferase involved in cell wall biosynthesis
MATISVCIPTYNGGKYLRETLQSLERQTFSDFDVVVTDDRSTDGTMEILEESTDRLPITVIRNEHQQGLPGNWNGVMDASTGAWIKFVFQDDPIAPTCLEEMLRAATTEGTRLVICDREPIYSDVSDSRRAQYSRLLERFSIGTVFKGSSRVTNRELCHAILDHGDENFLGEPVTTLFHRDVIGEFGYFNPSLIQLCDFEYWARIGTNEPIALIHAPLVQFRVHDDAQSVTNAKTRFYRMTVVEHLLLHKEYLDHPKYSLLREVAAERGVEMVDVLRRDARRALEIASDQAREGDPAALSEWNDLASTHPVLQEFARSSIPRDVRRIEDRSSFDRLRSGLRPAPRIYALGAAVVRYARALRHRSRSRRALTRERWLR